MLTEDDGCVVEINFEPGIGSTVKNPLSVTVQTPFCTFEVREKLSAGNKPETWFHLETKPAFEVALLTGNPGDLASSIVLLEKRRLQGDQPRIKVPGGYCQEKGEDYMIKKILADTGILVEEGSLNLLGHVIGHSEIVTPISLYWTERWGVVHQPRGGIRVFEVTLGEAARMAVGHKLENDSSFSLVMRLVYHCLVEGQLPTAASEEA